MKSGYVKLSIPEYESLMIGNYEEPAVGKAGGKDCRTGGRAQ